MAHYALLDENNIVTSVITGRDEHDDGVDWEQEYSNFLKVKVKRTSYNTYANIHNLGGIPFRKNYAGKGYSYDEVRDAFIPPKPSESYILNEETCLWENPYPIPDDGKEYVWVEQIKRWLEIPQN